MTTTSQRQQPVDVPPPAKRATMPPAVELSFAKDETCSLQVRHSEVTIECLAGIVWLTREGDLADHVLGRGGRFVTTLTGRLAMMALEPARIRLMHRRVPIRRGTGLAEP